MIDADPTITDAYLAIDGIWRRELEQLAATPKDEALEWKVRCLAKALDVLRAAGRKANTWREPLP